MGDDHVRESLRSPIIQNHTLETLWVSEKSSCLPASNFPLMSRTRSVCLAASAIDMSSSTLLSAGCTKIKAFSAAHKPSCVVRSLGNAHVKNWILLRHLEAQCKAQCQGARAQSFLTWSPTIPAGSSAAAGATIRNKNKELQPKLISPSHTQGADQPSLTFPVHSQKSFFTISLPGPSINRTLEETI